MDQIAVLIPCFNESRTIAQVIESYQKNLPESTIYVYDNNSTDGTDAIAKKHGAIVRYEYRQGKGNVLRSMFRDIDARCYLITDGDATYPAEYATKMCQPILEKKADMVIGDRLSTTYFQENKRPFHNWGNNIMCHAINLLWRPHQRIRDVMTGYRALSPFFVKSFPVLSQGFEIETEMTIHALDHNLLTYNMPIPYHNRPAGSYSKLHTFRDGRKIIFTLFQLYRDYKPLHFFTILSLLLSLISVAFFLPIFLEYLHTGLVPRFPTLIVSAFTMIAALLSFNCGLILSAGTVRERKYFELQMNTIKLIQKENICHDSKILGAENRKIE